MSAQSNVIFHCVISVSMMFSSLPFHELIGWRRMAADAFEVLPYVHIDYGHYVRLAECQAKCSHKYGHVTEKRRLDGSRQPSSDTSAEAYEMCEMGCSVYSKSPVALSPDLSSKESTHEKLLIDAFSDGQKYWRIVSGNVGGKHHLRQGHSHHHTQQNDTSHLSPIERIRTLCFEQSSNKNKPSAVAKRHSLLQNGGSASMSVHVFDSYEAFLTADLKDEFRQNRSINAHLRYIVQWRQRQHGTEAQKSGKEVEEGTKRDEETKWITASIETSNVFKVEGLQAGIQYRFMVTIIGPTGKIAGESVKSDWIDFEKLAEDTRKENLETKKKAALSFHSQYNLEDNVAAVVRWVHFNDIFKTVLPPNHPQLFPSQTSNDVETEYSIGNQGHTPLLFEGCRMQIEYSNKTTKIVEDFTVDESDGYLVKNLAFNSEYSVQIRPRQSLLAESRGFFMHEPFAEKEDGLKGKFLSMSCAQVYGAGSLECDPEPVQNVEITSHPGNSTVTIRWTPSSELHNILLYQLYYVPTTESVDCALEPTSQFLTANTTSASLHMPTLAECEFELHLINYDLLGREASATKTFEFTPNTITFNHWGVPPLELSQRNTGLLIGLCVIMGAALFVVIKFAAFWPERVKNVANSANYRPESPSSTASNASSRCSVSSLHRPIFIENL
ncbi:hypothetical protein DdX_03763 [Ditylenchus destructor]|uniref:Uncharacterized protein n=1 Tax=Ditylenchus destructor TaxID=166010 RepID=A0AAD4NAP2_9BILA|nr:hypothetical protein DdX_03763 [Ditylenchus destructor]